MKKIKYTRPMIDVYTMDTAMTILAGSPGPSNTKTPTSTIDDGSHLDSKGGYFDDFEDY